MNQISINNIIIFGYHGLYEHEQKEGQNFSLSVVYSKDEFIDYSFVVEKLINYFNVNRYNYLEDLANNLLDLMCNDFDFLYLKLIISKIDLPEIKLSNNMKIKVSDIKIEVERNVK